MRAFLACFAFLLLFAAEAYGLTFEGAGVPYETLETTHFMVRYEPGDDRAATDVSEALEGSYGRITGDLGLEPLGKTVVELYISPKLYNQYGKPASWAIGGKVYADRDMMIFPSPSTWGEANIHRYEDLWHVMPHEYTHVVLRRYSLPMWLDEGIAVYESSQWSKGHKRLLVEALEKDMLLSLRELEDFNTFLANGALSYAEGYTAVTYIKGVYGDEAFRELLKGIAMGLSFENALQAAISKDVGEFEEGWRRYLEEMLKPERHGSMLKSMGDAGAEVSIAALSAVDESPPRVISAKAPDYVSREELPHPWLLGASFAALLIIALFVKVLKALVRRAARPIL